MCGLPDPEGDDEMRRVCHGCVNPNNRKKSSTDPDAGTASSKRHWPGGQGTAEEKQAGAPRKKVRAQLNLDSDDDEADSSAGDKGQCTQPVLSPRPPPYTDVARQFRDLEGIAERCSMAGVSYHLRRVKLAWMSEAVSKKTKQTCVADFV